MADPNDNNWRIQSFRQKVIGQIEEAMRRAGNPTNKTSTEMENHIFQKAKTREEYLGLVARVIIHVREFNNKKGQLGAGGLGGAMSAQQIMGGGLPDPIGALQSLTKTNISPLSGAGGPLPATLVGAGPGQLQQPFKSYQGGPSGMMPGNINARMSTASTMQQGPSPGATSGLTSLPSPLSSQGPSPSSSGLVPSPSAQNPSDSMGRQSAGAPSPGQVNINLHTPGNPNSVGPIPSPANRTAEEQAYLDKWKQLQKYIDPLKRLINRISEEEGKEKDVTKMKNLLDILSDSTKRLPMATLLKCEAVLEKLDLQSKTEKGSVPTDINPKATTAAGKGEGHMFQPLLTVVAQHITNPLVNHTLHRTFGPACHALHGPPVRVPSPPPKRVKTSDKSDDKISPLLIGEIARLDRRFRVKLDPVFHSGSKTVQLICTLDDQNLPTVPPLSIRIPEDYPDTSPTCVSTQEDYDCTTLLSTTRKNFSTQLLALPYRFSLTQMLDTWEMSVRKSCAPRVK